jgi:hypothetical protein
MSAIVINGGIIAHREAISPIKMHGAIKFLQVRDGFNNWVRVDMSLISSIRTWLWSCLLMD